MLKLNVGFTKKVGEANYGSRGANVNLELELDSTLVGDAERLRERIKQLFVMAKAAVDEELAGAKSNGACANGHNGDDQTHGQAISRTDRPIRPWSPRKVVGVIIACLLTGATVVVEKNGGRHCFDIEAELRDRSGSADSK
jgi:hypothetical protein